MCGEAHSAPHSAPCPPAFALRCCRRLTSSKPSLAPARGGRPVRPPAGRAAWAAPTRRRRATACRGEAALPQGHRQGLRLGGSSCSLFASKAGVANAPPFSHNCIAVHELRGANRASSRRADDVEASAPQHKARPLRRHYYFLFPPPAHPGGGSSSRSSSSASSYAARARAGAAAALLPFGQAQEQSRQAVASLSGQ